MKYYKVDVFGENKEEYCFTNNMPGDIGNYELMSGESLKDEYPDDPFEITLKFDPDAPGLLTTSFLGNTNSTLIVKQEVAGLILKHETGEIEVWPFTLLNHDKKIHSKEYVFVKPIGTFDCINRDLSEVGIDSDNGEILGVEKWVLDKNKIKKAPDLFRLKEDECHYFFSEKLVNAIKKAGYSNFVFQVLDFG